MMQTAELNGVKNVVFDLGGVLLTWDPARIAAAVCDRSDAQKALVTELFEHPDWHDYDLGIITIHETVARFNTRTGFTIPNADVLLRAHLDSLDAIPDSVALLKELDANGFHVYCLSNVSRNIYDEIEARHPFFRLFHGAVISGDLQIGKPAPAIYQHLIEIYALDPAETVMLDDKPQNVEGARRVGMQGIVFSSARDCRARLCLP